MINFEIRDGREQWELTERWKSLEVVFGHGMMTGQTVKMRRQRGRMCDLRQV